MSTGTLPQYLGGWMDLWQTGQIKGQPLLNCHVKR